MMLITVAIATIPLVAAASATNGTIQANSYAWGNNTGWVNFFATNGGIQVTDSALTGYAWDSDYGWINMSPTDSGVMNDGEGDLSGYAWSQGGGWIDFKNVTIDSSGKFHGTATGPSYGMINFDCNNCSVTTDWRPQSVRTPAPSSSSYQGSSFGGTMTLVRQSDGGYLPVPNGSISNQEATTQPQTIFQNVLNDILAPFSKPAVSVTIGNPYAANAPTASASSSVSEQIKKFLQNFTLASLSTVQISFIPQGVVFAKPDLLPTYQSVGPTETYIPQGQTLDLAVKTDHPVSSITGYVTLNKIDLQTALNYIQNQRDTSTSSSATNLASVETALEASSSSQQKLVLQVFNYKDSGNGIYTAQISAPRVHGTYDILTVLNYTDKSLKSREIHTTMIVDPEGYIYTVIGGLQARIPHAVASLYELNPETNTFDLWAASRYRQINPQTTDITGGYSFLVPPGIYQLDVSAAGYYDYKSQPFDITSGAGVHEDIQMQPVHWWVSLWRWLSSWF